MKCPGLKFSKTQLQLSCLVIAVGTFLPNLSFATPLDLSAECLKKAEQNPRYLARGNLSPTSLREWDSFLFDTTDPCYPALKKQAMLDNREYILAEARRNRCTVSLTNSDGTTSEAIPEQPPAGCKNFDLIILKDIMLKTFEGRSVGSPTTVPAATNTGVDCDRDPQTIRADALPVVARIGATAEPPIAEPPIDETWVGLSLEDRLRTAGNKKQYCTYKYLKSLGWSFPESDAASFVEHTYQNSCQYTKLEHVQNRLSVPIPKSASREDFQKFMAGLPELSESDDVLCTYKFKYGDALYSAVWQLDKNYRAGNYSFPKSQTTLTDFGGDSKRFGWILAPDRQSQQPNGTRNIKAAVGAYLDKGPLTLDCLFGMQEALAATEYTLYGEAFDQAYSPEELEFSNGKLLRSRPGAFFGTNMGASFPDLVGRNAIQMGPQALIGMTGGIRNKGEYDFATRPGLQMQYELEKLQTPADRGENFVIVSVDKAATNYILEDGGTFASINRDGEKLWRKIIKDLSPEFRTLLYEKNSKLESKVGGHQKAVLAEIRAFMQLPHLSGIKVYVHPLGIMNFGQHFARLAKENPGTEYKIHLYRSNTNWGRFQRHRDTMIDICERETNW